MARLARTAYAIVWVSPLKGHIDYQPSGAGMKAPLPHIDRFLPGHNIASLEDLAEAPLASSAGTRHKGEKKLAIEMKSDALSELVDPAAEVERVATGFTFTEGPVANKAGDFLRSPTCLATCAGAGQRQRASPSCG